MKDSCDANHLHACGAPPFTFASLDAICEEGSLPVILVILFFFTIFAIKQILYLQRKRNNKKVNGIMKMKQGSSGSDSNANILLGTIGYHSEEVFVKPFVPTSLEDMITTMYFCYFLLTITMGITRYYEKHWANDPLAQQGPFNLVSWAFGCESIKIDGLVYTPKLPDLLEDGTNQKKQGLFGFLVARVYRKVTAAEDVASPSSSSSSSTNEDDDENKDYFETIDLLFTLHLIMGTAWLTIGFLQIVWTRTGWSTDPNVRRTAHRFFGRFAMISFVLHMGVASIMAYANPVKQAMPIVLFYWIDIADNWIQAGMGIAWAIHAKRLRDVFGDHQQEEDEYEDAKNMHQFRMVTVYLRSTFGSGAIRFTVWLLWLIGKCVSFETRILIDRGECQAHAQLLGSDQMGQADMCLKPVFLNLAATDVFVVWLEWLFVCLLAQEDKKLTAMDATATKNKLLSYVIAGLAYLATLCLGNDSMAPYVIIFYALCTKLRVIHDHVGRFMSNLIGDGYDPTTTAVGAKGDLMIITRESISMEEIATAKFRFHLEDAPGLDESESSFDDDSDGNYYGYNSSQYNSSEDSHPHQD